MEPLPPSQPEAGPESQLVNEFRDVAQKTSRPKAWAETVRTFGITKEDDPVLVIMRKRADEHSVTLEPTAVTKLANEYDGLWEAAALPLPAEMLDHSTLVEWFLEKKGVLPNPTPEPSAPQPEAQGATQARLAEVRTELEQVQEKSLTEREIELINQIIGQGQSLLMAYTDGAGAEGHGGLQFINPADKKIITRCEEPARYWQDVGSVTYQLINKAPQFTEGLQNNHVFEVVLIKPIQKDVMGKRPVERNVEEKGWFGRKKIVRKMVEEEYVAGKEQMSVKEVLGIGSDEPAIGIYYEASEWLVLNPRGISYDQQVFRDRVNRPGNNLNFGMMVPESLARQFVSLMQEDPALPRKLLYETVRQKYPLDYQQGPWQTYSHPPYEAWEQLYGRSRLYFVDALSNPQTVDQLGNMPFDKNNVIEFVTAPPVTSASAEAPASIQRVATEPTSAASPVAPPPPEPPTPPETAPLPEASTLLGEGSPFANSAWLYSPGRGEEQYARRFLYRVNYVSGEVLPSGLGKWISQARVFQEDYPPRPGWVIEPGIRSQLVIKGNRGTPQDQGSLSMERANLLLSNSIFGENSTSRPMKIYGYGVDEKGSPYILLECLDPKEFQSTDEYLSEKGGSLSQQEAVEIALGVVESILPLHMKGLTHFDIGGLDNQSNIFWDPVNKRVRLIDLEQPRKEEYAYRGDIQHIGSALFRIITGENYEAALNSAQQAARRQWLDQGANEAEITGQLMRERLKEINTLIRSVIERSCYLVPREEFYTKSSLGTRDLYLDLKIALSALTNQDTEVVRSLISKEVDYTTNLRDVATNLGGEISQLQLSEIPDPLNPSGKVDIVQTVLQEVDAQTGRNDIVNARYDINGWHFTKAQRDAIKEMSEMASKRVELLKERLARLVEKPTTVPPPPAPEPITERAEQVSAAEALVDPERLAGAARIEEAARKIVEAKHIAEGKPTADITPKEINEALELLRRGEA